MIQSPLENPNANETVRRLKKAIHDHWRLFLVEGVVLVALGVAAIIVPPFASLTFAIFLGWLFIVSGAFGLAATFMARGAPGFGWALISAIVTLLAGIYLVGWPLSGVISLTLVLAAFLVADGIFTILFAAEHRRELSRRWGWLLVNGILDLALAALIFIALPGAAVWALGLIVGIDLLFGGFSLIAMALSARKEINENAIP